MEYFFRFFLFGICSFVRFRISPRHQILLLCGGTTLGSVHFFVTVRYWASEFSCNITWFSVTRFDGA